MTPENPSETQAPAHPPFRRRGHIVLVLLAVLVAVGLVPLLTISSKFIGKSRESLTTAQQQIQLQVASSVAHGLDMQVGGLRSQLVRVAQTLGAAVRHRGTVPREEIRRVLTEVTDDRMVYLRYTFFEGQGFRSVSAGDHPEYLEPLFQASLQQAAELLAGAKADRGAGAILSDPIVLRGLPRRAVMLIVAPVVSKGSFRGVLSGLVEMQRVWDGVAVGQGLDSHLVFALDPDGTVFATNDPERQRVGSDVPQSELLRRFLNHEVRRYTIPFTVERDGEEQHYIGTFDLTGQGWGIFVQAPGSEIYWSVSDMEQMTLKWTLALVVLAALVAMVLARNLSNPINKLAATARALAQGDFSARANIQSRSEIGELAHAFNSMAEDIESYIRRLREANREINELFLGTIHALSEAIDAKDPYTEGHSQRVNRYSMILARQLGLSEQELREIHVASLLHDVGKIGIEDHILKKTSALTDEEFEIIKTHPVLGANIMAPIRQMEKMIPGLRYHHERCDGSGYPDGLQRDQIPRMARIIAVADTFDAITTTRPYQNPMTFERAIARINELRGHALDDEVVEAFNGACRTGLIRLEGGPEPAAPKDEESSQIASVG